VKKAKEITNLNLYNFNADDSEEKQKIKKVKPKKKTAKKNSNVKNKEENGKIDLNNEIVIGLPKIENKVSEKNINRKTKNQYKTNKKTKTKNKKKKSKNNKKAKKVTTKTQVETKNRKIKRNLKIAKYSFLSIGTIAIIILTMTSPLFNIKEIIVQGNSKITRDEIISLSQINVEQNTYKTNMKKSKKNILENPYIKTVEIKRSLPSTVIIKVEERKTAFMIEYGNGYIYVNNQGYILEISAQKLEVPIIQGTETNVEEFVPGSRLTKNDLEKMSTVIKIMEVAINNEIGGLITRIDIENKNNYKILFETEQKVAYLGDETDLNTKILSIKSIIEKEKGVAGEIFVNSDLKDNNPVFRQNV